MIYVYIIGGALILAWLLSQTRQTRPIGNAIADGVARFLMGFIGTIFVIIVLFALLYVTGN